MSSSKSTNIVADANGAAVASMRYLPWGEERYANGMLNTTFRYTGQRQEDQLGGSEGLYYYGARWYDPVLGRFASPDSIVPETYNPQDWDRHAYVRNNPVRYVDPTGHRPCNGQNSGGLICDNIRSKDIKSVISATFGWGVKGNFSLKELDNIIGVGDEIASFTENLSGRWGIGWIRSHLGNASFVRSDIADLLNTSIGASASVPFGHVITVSGFLSKKTAAHELGHVLDNNVGITDGAERSTWFGGGPSDAMVAAMGGHPELCNPRFQCRNSSFKPIGYESYILNIAGNSPWEVQSYGNNGVADDFAETFAYSIYNPGEVPTLRYTWLQAFLSLLP